MRKQPWMTSLAAMGLGLGAMVGGASAQQDVPGPIDSLTDLQDTGRIIFKLVDENNDGQVSQAEATNAGYLAVGGLFFRADANGDGAVTKQEAQAARDAFLAQKPLVRFMIERAQTTRPAANAGTANPAAALMTLVDGNGDGNLQAAEVRQMVQTVVQGTFAAADTNRDGQMSPTEVNAAIVGAVKAAQQASFQAADTNNDGQIDKAEFTKSLTDPANAAFAVLDANNDGRLSQQELQSAQRIVEQQIRRMVVPEPANSARNLLNGVRPEQVSPIPNLGGQQAQPGQPVQQVQPVQPVVPR